MVAYFLFGVVYCYFFWKHLDSTLPLHRAVLFVFMIALTEATCWYAAYQTINLTGQPYCCPFPPTVVASLVLQIFRQTFARTLLLVVTLGYGIVRPKLLPAEWVAISIVSVLYFITGDDLIFIPHIRILLRSYYLKTFFCISWVHVYFFYGHCYLSFYCYRLCWIDICIYLFNFEMLNYITHIQLLSLRYRK